MTISVHTNKSALTALQNLNKTNDQLAETQNRVNTGLRISNAKDNVVPRTDGGYSHPQAIARNGPDIISAHAWNRIPNFQDSGIP